MKDQFCKFISHLNGRVKRVGPFAVILFAAIISAENINAQTAAIAAIDEPEVAIAIGGGSSGNVRSGSNARGADQRQQTSSANRRRTSAANTRNTRNNRRTTAAANTKAAPKRTVDPAKYDGFVIGDKYSFLNFEVISAEKPYHTRAAKKEGAEGLVQVEVLIDEDGSVLTAKARTGNKLLHSEAERAAMASKFNKPAVYGKPARAIGFLVYRFGTAND